MSILSGEWASAKTVFLRPNVVKSILANDVVRNSFTLDGVDKGCRVLQTSEIGGIEDFVAALARGWPALDHDNG